jgi:hypothetical protein
MEIKNPFLKRQALAKNILNWLRIFALGHGSSFGESYSSEDFISVRKQRVQWGHLSTGWRLLGHKVKT